MTKKTNFFVKLIQNNTGVSIKNFAVFCGVMIALVWVLIYLPAFILLDQIWKYKMTINLYGITALVGAIEAILAILITGKVKSEQYEQQNGLYRDSLPDPGQANKENENKPDEIDTI